MKDIECDQTLAAEAPDRDWTRWSRSSGTKGQAPESLTCSVSDWQVPREVVAGS